MSALRSPVRERPAAAGVAVVALAALALRLYALDARSAHWDEARVGYWTLRYAETGAFAYRLIIHGPFLPVVERRVFVLLGPSMAAARLPVALLGAATPLAAWLFRDSLDDAELAAAAVLLAVDPLSLYYSRFVRADVPLAAFALFAFGFAARALATGRRRYLFAAAALGLGLTTKENVLVYLACWGGAAAVAVAVRAAWRARADAPRAALAATGRAVGGRARPLLPAVPAAAALALLVAAWFYAPRGAAGDPSLGTALADPVRSPALLAASTLGAWETFAGSLWTGEAAAGNPYLPYLAHYVAVLAVGSAPLYALAVVGAAVEHRIGTSTTDLPRALVTVTAAWGAASVIGYPLGTDIMAPWLGVHAVVPLSAPAAVGLVACLRRARARFRAGDRAAAGAVCLALLILAGQLAAVGGVAVDATPTPRVNLLAQGAQPGDDLAPLAADVEAAADDGGVLYVGERFLLENESVADAPPEEGATWPGRWLRRLPLAWYTERVGAPTASVPSAATLDPRSSSRTPSAPRLSVRRSRSTRLARTT